MGNGQRNGENTLDYVQRIIREGAERNETAHQEFLERQRAYEERQRAYEERQRAYEERERAYEERQRVYEERQGRFEERQWNFEERGKQFDQRMAFLAERMITFEMGMAEMREQHQKLVAENNRKHDEFEAEHRRLLTSQVLMNEAMQKMGRAAEILELKMAETTDKLNALIDIVQNQKRNGNAPAQ